MKSSTAAATAALGFPSILPASAAGANDRIALGCIGVGQRCRKLMELFLWFKEVRIVAVCDPFADRQRKAKAMVDGKYGDQGCAMVGDYRDLIARRDIDAVVIGAQDHWHALIATAAAKAGKDMYCEKPLGVCVRDSQAIRDAVRGHRRIFQTGTHSRSYGNCRQACELVRGGYIGRVHTVHVAAQGPRFQPKYKGSLDPQPVPEGLDWDMWLGPALKKPYNPGRVGYPDWYLIWDYCAGFICNWGVHCLDIALWGCPELGTEPCELECEATWRNEGFSDNVRGWHSTFTYPNGLKMIYSDEDKQEFGIKFIGEKGWIYTSWGGGGIRAEPESLLSIKIAPEDRKLRKSDNHGEDFLLAVRDRCDPVSDVDAGHRATTLGLLADISARLKQKLKWDPKTESFVGNDAANAMLSRPMHNGWKLERET